MGKTCGRLLKAGKDRTDVQIHFMPLDLLKQTQFEQRSLNGSLLCPRTASNRRLKSNSNTFQGRSPFLFFPTESLLSAFPGTKRKQNAPWGAHLWPRGPSAPGASRSEAAQLKDTLREAQDRNLRLRAQLEAAGRLYPALGSTFLCVFWFSLFFSPSSQLPGGFRGFLFQLLVWQGSPLKSAKKGCFFFLRIGIYFRRVFVFLFSLLASWLLGFLASRLLGFLASWLFGFLASLASGFPGL